MTEAVMEGTDCHPGIEDLADTGVLMHRIRSVCALRPNVQVVVGVATAEGATCIEHRNGASESCDSKLVQVGCLSKLFLPALALEILGWEGLSTPGVLGGAQPTRLDDTASITFGHLLDHTHGLDGTSVATSISRSDGCLDLSALLMTMLRYPVLADPGALHSYSNASAWLAAAVLEADCGRPFAQFLQTHLRRESYGSSNRVLSVLPRACPATGEGMRIACRTFLDFLSSHWDSGINYTVLSERSGITDLPGWSGAEVGIRSGWKWYGESCFGHSSGHPGAFGIARVDTRKRLAFFVLSQAHPCNSIASALFSTWMPSFTPRSIPRLRDNPSREEMDCYLATYRLADTSVAIRSDREAQLRLFAHDIGSDVPSSEPFYAAALRAAEDHLFYTQPRHADLFPYIQFIRPSMSGFDYVWNGKQVWRKIEAET